MLKESLRRCILKMEIKVEAILVSTYMTGRWFTSIDILLGERLNQVNYKRFEIQYSQRHQKFGKRFCIRVN